MRAGALALGSASTGVGGTGYGRSEMCEPPGRARDPEHPLVTLYGRTRPGDADPWWGTPARDAERALMGQLGQMWSLIRDVESAAHPLERKMFLCLLYWIANYGVSHVVIATWDVLADDLDTQREAVRAITRLGARVHAAVVAESAATVEEFDSLRSSAPAG
jgi:hypothetical protein